MKKFLRFLLILLLASVVKAHGQTANPDANPKARAILEYFSSLEKRTDKRLISGQFSDFGNGASVRIVNQIHEQSGHWPALLGVDYVDFGKSDLTHANPNKAAIEYWKAGGLVTVSAHLYNPAKTNPAAGSRDGGLRDKDVDLATLLDTNSDTHGRWMMELDKLADGLQELKDAGVVVIWRPFHEMNGNWFWWDGKDPAAFTALWHQMFDYFTKTKKLDNLLWAFGPNHGNNTDAYYPGDAYVDLVGLDAYTDFIDTQHIKGYAKLAAIKKPFGFTEFGPHGASNPPGDFDYTKLLEGLQTNFSRAVFFMSWNAKWSLASNNHVKEFLDSPVVVNREDLPPGLAGKP
jgi:mannan endo-1,4-beta-mannosidase